MCARAVSNRGGFFCACGNSRKFAKSKGTDVADSVFAPRQRIIQKRDSFSVPCDLVSGVVIWWPSRTDRLPPRAFSLTHWAKQRLSAGRLVFPKRVRPAWPEVGIAPADAPSAKCHFVAETRVSLSFCRKQVVFANRHPVKKSPNRAKSGSFRIQIFAVRPLFSRPLTRMLRFCAAKNFRTT